MPQIVISEFMDESAVAGLAKDYDVLYDPQLVDRPDALADALGDATALIVRNRTQVRPALLDAAGLAGLHVDIVQPDAQSSDHLQVRQPAPTTQRLRSMSLPRFWRCCVAPSSPAGRCCRAPGRAER